MWHEARRQEKKIRGMMVDYRKRAERRRNFYEKFKADPTQFIQLHGRPCKIHIDASVAAAGDASSVMMPWQGHHDLMIDRFDVRAHLDYIQDHPSEASTPDEELSTEDRHTNYERYRILVQNDYLGVEEEKFLHQIYLEEQFGPIALKQNSDGVIEKEKDKEKEKRKKGAAIGFTYDEPSSSSEPPCLPSPVVDPDTGDDSETDDDSEFDFDLCLDLSEVDTSSAHELNRIGQRFGLVSNDFYSYLINDVEEQETLRLAREQEEEKAMYSGRRARRERQAYREKRLVGRVVSPPSYAARQSPTYEKFKSCSKSKSRSPSPDSGGEITYITSFSGEEPSVQIGKPIPVIGVQHKPLPIATRRTRTPSSSPARSPLPRPNSKSPRRSRSRSRDSHSRRPRKIFSPRRAKRSPSPRRYRRSGSRSRSRSRGRRRSRSRSVHRYRRSRSRSRRRSRSPSYMRRRYSRSRSRSWSKSKSRSPSVSQSRASKLSSPPRRAPLTPTTDKAEVQPAVPRYYGRNRKDSSSSIDISSEDEAQESATSSGAIKDEVGRGCGSVSGRSDVKSAAKRQPRETPQEKLKRRMQVLLSRQFKQDKRLEREKAEKAEQERQDRAAELRDIAIRIRRRERYLRHYEDGDRDRDRGRDRSRSRDRGRSRERSRDRERSYERSRERPRDHYGGRHSLSPRSDEGDRHSFGTPPSRTLVDY